jgi:hypothetical protein
MTEAEWLSYTDPIPMLEYLRGRASDRKLRLLACACCRRIWHLPDSVETSHRAVETAERFADGLVQEEEIRQAEQAAWDAWYPDEATPREQMGFTATAAFASVAGRPFRLARENGHVIERTVWENCVRSIRDVLWVAGKEEVEGRFEPERDRQFRNEVAQLMRCVIGSPFRSALFNPAWHTPTVLAMSQVLYEDRAFDRLPILADALEDAGCDNQDMLDHCRGPGPHVRGCWVLDLILGKE